ncbi:MAG: protein phosphatase CheZ [bacterium]
MNPQQLDNVLQKVSELKVFFDFGERTLPLLEEVATFTQEIGPVIEGIKSLVDVTSQKLPKAAEQLGRVNQFAERASNDILNTVDKMVATIEGMQTPDHNRVVGDLVDDTTKKVSSIVDSLARRFGNDEDIIELLNAWDLHSQSLSALNTPTTMQMKLESLREDCTNIMMSLQVQDITGQQIASVIGLMQAVDDVLRKLLTEVSDIIQFTQPEQPVVILPSTEYVGMDERKKMVDSLLRKARTGDLSIENGGSSEKNS